MGDHDASDCPDCGKPLVQPGFPCTSCYAAELIAMDEDEQAEAVFGLVRQLLSRPEESLHELAVDMVYGLEVAA